MSEKLAVLIHGGAMKVAEVEEKAQTKALTEALEASWTKLTSGAPGEEAVVAALRVLEGSGYFDAGRGAFPNEEGEASLDVALMKGSGEFASVLNIGELAFASEVALDVLRAGESRIRVWSEKLREELTRKFPKRASHYGFVSSSKELISEYAMRAAALYRPRSPDTPRKEAQGEHGTVGCVVRDASGALYAGTSTGGTPWKPVGRIGDAPIIGAGVYAEDAICALSATGHGEAILRSQLSAFVIATMRQQLLLDNAAFTDGGAALTRIIDTELARFSALCKGSTAGLIVLPAAGDPVYRFNSDCLPIAWRTLSNGTRREEVKIASIK